MSDIAGHQIMRFKDSLERMYAIRTALIAKKGNYEHHPAKDALDRLLYIYTALAVEKIAGLYWELGLAESPFAFEEFNIKETLAELSSLRASQRFIIAFMEQNSFEPTGKLVDELVKLAVEAEECHRKISMI